LLPMLQRQDLSAYRARAFGLAILGETDEAAALANRLMPPDLSSRMAPYLAYMPRLTSAQQAAAANLGIFPRAAQIGRDDPRIARYATSGDLPAVDAGNRLAPRGTPLGQSAPPAAPARESRLAQVARTQASPPTSVSEAFNGLAGPTAASASSKSAGAVDITKIDIPRESRAEADPPPPLHPSRHWVQMATGRDLNALKFDWRKMARRAPELLEEYEPHVTRWGQANRLLAGPLSSRDAAQELVRALRVHGFDSFAYTSPTGEDVIELK
ncbi:MAG TPA: SPOR domain-containing protein, partial [Erythrobacter sp.]|nr:SPOR domain-containing protein [Erythrobacter sp.]